MEIFNPALFKTVQHVTGDQGKHSSSHKKLHQWNSFIPKNNQSWKNM